jgi:hypothetical protein
MRKSLYLLVALAFLAATLSGGVACKKTNTSDGNSKNAGKKQPKRNISQSILKRLGIAKTPKADANLDVLHVYAPSLSELGSITSVIEAYDARIVVTKVIFYSGPVYEHWKETKAGKSVERITPMRSSTTIMSTFENLGYEVYVGYGKGGFKQIKDTYLKDRLEGTYQEFKNQDEAVDFLKRLLSSGFPVIAQLDTTILGEDQGVESVVVSGFDAENIFVSDSSFRPDEGGKNRAIKIDDFKKAWSSGLVAKTPDLFFFVEGLGKERPDVEILAEMKNEANSIPSYLDKDAERLEKKDVSIKYFQSLANLCGAKRTALVVFLKDKNFNDIAEQYNEIAQFYGDMRQETDVKEAAKKLREAAKKEKQAARNWD